MPATKVTPEPTVIKPGQALRLTKQGKLPKPIKGGHPRCRKCRQPDKQAGTEAPTFWENGSYCSCAHGKTHTLHGAIYPPCAGYPNGILIDTSGARKKYPLLPDFAIGGDTAS